MTNTTLLKYSIINLVENRSIEYDTGIELEMKQLIVGRLNRGQQERKWNWNDKSLFKLLHHKTSHWQLLCDFGNSIAEISYLYRRFDVMNKDDLVATIWMPSTGLYDYNPNNKKFTPLHVCYWVEEKLIDEIEMRIACYERQKQYEKEFIAPFDPSNPDDVFLGTSGIEDPMCPEWLRPKRKRGTKKEWIWEIK